MDFINLLKNMSNTETTAIMQRVRHEFRARHVQLLAREQISPGFIRLTVGGPELQGFVSAGFDDHSKLILPQAGQEKPNLPQIIDGRPHIEGARPEMRDYTPINYDAARNTLQLEFAVHGTGPAVEWARSAPLGQWLGLAGPGRVAAWSSLLTWTGMCCWAMNRPCLRLSAVWPNCLWAAGPLCVYRLMRWISVHGAVPPNWICSG